MSFQNILSTFYWVIKRIGIRSLQVIAINLVLNLLFWLIFIFGSLFNLDIKKRTNSTKALINESDIKMLNDLGFYLRKEEIGNGYYGTVYKAYHTSRATHKVESMAIKVIDVRKYENFLIKINEIDRKSLKTIFNKSVNNLVKIENKRIVRIEKVLKTLSKDKEIHKLFLFTQTAEMNLNDFISRQKPKGLDEDWARIWFRHICEAVQCLHNVYKVSHQNIKPENILLFHKTTQTDNQIPFDVKLADTGIANLFPNSAKVCSKRNPICVLSSGDRLSIDSMADDIYNLAVLLLVLLRGDPNQFVFDIKPFALFANFNDRYLEEVTDNMLNELLSSMMNRSLESRIDINEVLGHQWLQQN